MIKQYTSIIQQDLNDILYESLLRHSGWNLIVDSKFSKFNAATDSGMILASMANGKSNGDQYNDLNFYAEIILQLIVNKTKVSLEHTEVNLFNDVKMLRCYWNYYHSNSIGIDHPDTMEENHWSIVYYLNDVKDAGTKIIDENNDTIIVPSISTNAVLFPSSYIHCGLPPKNYEHRCCLNIIFKAHSFYSNQGPGFMQDPT
jgi:hypothetical protein